MKKAFTTVLLSLTICLLFGQHYPGDNPELLLNKKVKVKELFSYDSSGILIDNDFSNEMERERGYEHFFYKYNTRKKEFLESKKNKPFPIGILDRNSDYTKLVGKEFTVLDVFEINPHKVFPDEKLHGLKLENPEIGIIYYKYNPNTTFQLEILGDIDYPVDFFCSVIDSKTDKFTGEETYTTPYQGGITFIKTINDGSSRTYLSIIVGGSTVNVREKGLYIIFEDGSKFTRLDADIDCDVSRKRDRSYDYKSFIGLSTDELKMFSEKMISDVRLFIYDSKISNEQAFKIREYAKCLIE